MEESGPLRAGSARLVSFGHEMVGGFPILKDAKTYGLGVGFVSGLKTGQSAPLATRRLLAPRH